MRVEAVMADAGPPGEEHEGPAVALELVGESEPVGRAHETRLIEVRAREVCHRPREDPGPDENQRQGP